MESDKPKRKPQGRFTEKSARTICESLKNGASIEAAAAGANISRRTIYNWLERGKLDGATAQYKKFAEQVEQSKALFEVRMVKVIARQATEAHTEITTTTKTLEDENGKPTGKKEIIETTKHILPNARLACWLLERRRAGFQPRQEIEHTETERPPIKIEFVKPIKKADKPEASR